jgi:glycerate-2-kinase
MIYITNWEALTRNHLRQKALKIINAGYQALDIKKVINKKIKIKNKKYLVIDTYAGKRIINLATYQKIFLIGIGKGSALSCLTLSSILKKYLQKGIALDIKKINTPNKTKVTVLTGTHPFPSQKNVRNTQKIIQLVKNLKKNDLLINFICGGGSALLCGSKTELKYSALATQLLTQAGANIKKINIVRKHLSNIKGGQLAKLAYPANVITLIVSDVPTTNNDLSIVASGPTIFDKTTKADAKRILNQYLAKNKKQKPKITQLIKKLKETPKNKKYFLKTQNILFLSNQEPIISMAEEAKKLGLKSQIYSLKLEGEARQALIPLLKKMNKSGILLAGGETTVKLESKYKTKIDKSLKNFKKKFFSEGKGGRNQETILGALLFIANGNLKSKRKNSIVIASVASDGKDNTEAAGAIADITTLKKAKNLRIQDFLNKHNAFNFFKKTGDLVFVKSKHFNVADLILILKENF